MSVWPSLVDSRRTLAGSEGILNSIVVHVEPRHLEALLDALAQLSFPINPQIYHDASVEYIYANGRREAEPTTLVEFPAYDNGVAEVREALASYGLPPDALHVTDMLEGLRSDVLQEPAPAGADYVGRIFRRHAEALSAGAL
ncbi:MAG TPA: hypothetical protein VN442_07390 [Bryobacteraceae bacterium]|nr:hypothetical protein [Bryobacteraceae bacterium]